MNKKMVRCFYLAVVVGCIILAAAFFASTTDKIIINNEPVTPFNDGWRYFVNGEPGSQAVITLPTPIDAKKNDVVLLENTLPDSYPEGMTVCFRSSNQYVRVLVEGAEVYRFGHDTTRPFGSSPGSAWNFIRLQKDTAGGKICIELISPYDNAAKDIPQVHYGSKNSNVFYILNQNLAGTFISFLIIIAATLLFIVYTFFRRHTKSDYLLYLAWFALLAGLWSLAESRIAQFSMSNQYLVALMSFFAFMLMPIPLLLFVAETHSLHHKKPFYILCWLLLTNFVVVAGLQLFGVADLLVTLVSTHVLILAGAITIVATILFEVIKCRNKDVYILGLGTSAFVIISMLDLVKFYTNRQSGYATYFRFAVLFYILILTYYTVRKLLTMMTQNVRTQMLEQLAFIDLLTTLQNRTAFEKAMEPYRRGTVSCDKLWIGIFDINNLKLVNDTQGHKAGDNLLCAAVDCMKSVFGTTGEIYRIGGDEFAMLSKSLSVERLPELLKSFEAEVARVCEQQQLGLSVAYGAALFDADLDKTVDGLYVRADGYMYAKKHEEKSKSLA